MTHYQHTTTLDASPHLNHPLQLLQDGSVLCCLCKQATSSNESMYEILSVITDVIAHKTVYVIKISPSCSGIAIEYWEIYS
jgi:hypothetical protein